MTGFFLVLSVSLALLLAVHYVVFSSIAHFFSLSGGWWRFLVLALSFLVPASFFGASATIHFVEGPVFRVWYLLSAVSLGFVSNLFFLSLAAWVIFLSARFLEFQPKAVFFGYAILVSGAVLSLYGVFSAFSPIVKRIEVDIQGLPESWKGKAIVHLSDVHLGPVYREEFLRKIVDRVNDIRPAAVMITGDLFDGTDGNLETLVAPLGDIRSEQGVFFVTGNHETYLGVDRVLSALEKSGIEVLDDETIVTDGVAIMGVSYPDRWMAKDVPKIATSLVEKSGSLPNILLYHSPSDIDRMRMSGVDLQLSGHTHRGQQFPFQLVTFFVHKGYDHGLFSSGKYSLYVSSGVGTWGPPMRIGTRPEIVVITLR